jgi:hemerythrin-like metal-binding protein/PAS domain S-box-containing protein
MTPDFASAPLNQSLEWLRTPQLGTPSALVSGALAMATLLAALALAFLAWRRADRLDRRKAAFCSLAFFIFASMHAMDAFYTPAPTSPIRLAAALAGMVTALIFVWLVPRMLAAPTLSQIRALGQEKDRALGDLKKKETQFGRLIQEVKEYAIYFLDVQGRVVSWNPGAERIKGWPTEEILGQSFSRFYPEEAIRAGAPERGLRKAREDGIFMEEGWRVRKDGSRFLAHVVISALYDEDGQLTGYSKVTRDITESRRAEERLQSLAGELEAKVKAQTAELHESEARLLGFIRRATTGIAFKGLDGRFLLINPRYAELLGVPEAEILGRTPEEVLPMDICRPWLDQERRVRERQEEVRSEEDWPRDGRTPVRHYLSQLFPLTDTSGQCWGVGVMVTDITERKEAELAYLQSQKLESLGILAGGLAHDFNNLLGAMGGNVELAKLAAGPGAPVKPYLQTLEELIGRSSSLVQQILAYAGRGATNVIPLDLNRQVEDMARLMRTALPRKAVLHLEQDPDLPLIQGDPGQIQQVIMNLALNASEAIADQGGTITIRTGQEWLDASAIHGAGPGQDLEPGRHVLLEVADDGPGMPPEVVERIFDPFFTTKFTGRGLGLSAVVGILKAHHGCVQVRSEPGKGTNLKLLFPVPVAVEPPKVLENQDFEQAIDGYRGSGTVLVVDDEDPLRATATEALRHIGFETLEARDGLEALETFNRNRDRIRLILMDLTMPRMDGEDAYRKLRDNGLLAPVILTSGFSQGDVLRHFKSRGIAGFLQKPYRLQALVQMIRKVLPGAEEGAGAPAPGGRQPLAPASEFTMGCALLDQQHLRLVEAYNRLVEAMAAGGRRKERERALAALKEVALTHFGVEETLMERLAYPKTREHQTSHARLIGQINGLSDRIRQGTLDFTPPLLDFLECWLIHHTQDDDRRLALFLKAEGH